MSTQPLIYQLAAVVTANLNILAVSLLNSIPYSLGDLNSRWFVLSYLKGIIIGSVIAAVTLAYIGRRISILLAAIPTIVGLILAANAGTAFQIYTARWLSGIANGLVLTSALIYLSELSVRNRGALVSSIVVTRLLGPLISTSVIYSTIPSATYSYFWIIPSLLSVTILLVPESPYTYIKKDNIQAASRSLTLFRGNDGDLEGIVAAVKENNGGLMTLFRRDACAKGLAIAIILRIVEVLCGMQFITLTFFLYGVTYFHGYLKKMQYVYMAMYAVPTVTSIVACFLVDRVGRRPLLIASLLGVFVCLLAETIRTFVSATEAVHSDASLKMNIAIVALYNIIYHLGCANIVFLTAGEVFPLHVKPLGVALTEIATVWVAVGDYELRENLRSDLRFTDYSVFTYLVAVPITAWFVWKKFIETKAKPLEGIHEQLKSQHERFASKPHQQNMQLLQEPNVQ